MLPSSQCCHPIPPRLAPHPRERSSTRPTVACLHTRQESKELFVEVRRIYQTPFFTFLHFIYRLATSRKADSIDGRSLELLNNGGERQTPLRICNRTYPFLQFDFRGLFVQGLRKCRFLQNGVRSRPTLGQSNNRGHRGGLLVNTKRRHSGKKQGDSGTSNR